MHTSPVTPLKSVGGWGRPHSKFDVCLQYCTIVRTLHVRIKFNTRSMNFNTHVSSIYQRVPFSCVFEVLAVRPASH